MRITRAVKAQQVITKETLVVDGFSFVRAHLLWIFETLSSA
jgi:hypothetical protein